MEGERVWYYSTSPPGGSCFLDFYGPKRTVFFLKQAEWGRNLSRVSVGQSPKSTKPGARTSLIYPTYQSMSTGGGGKEQKSEGEVRNRYEAGFVNVKEKFQGELLGKVS